MDDSICQTDKAKQLLHQWATRPCTLRHFKLLCQPFVSQAEKEKSVVGVKSDSIKLKGMEFSSLALPRLQLRAVTVLELEDTEACVEEVKSLLTLLDI